MRTETDQNMIQWRGSWTYKWVARFRKRRKFLDQNNINQLSALAQRRCDSYFNETCVVQTAANELFTVWSNEL
jgi:hypothetical protein